MKATGVVRRIDELGRIVIPKEIRKNFRIKEGENIEIYIDDSENIILKKHSTLNGIGDLANIITQSIYQLNDKCVLITDTSNIISIEGKYKKDFINKELNSQFFNILESRSKILEHKQSKIQITEEEIICSYVINPILLNGDLIGSIVILSENNIDNIDISLTDMAVKILTKYIEE